MGSKKLWVVLSLVILFVMPMILALDTPIKIKTQKDLEVTIRVLDVGGTGTLEGGAFLDISSGDDGIAEVVYSSETVNKIDVSIMLRKGGTPQKFADGSSVRLINNNEEHIKTGWPVEIDITIDPPILIKSGKPDGVESGLATINDTGSDSGADNIDVVVDVEDETEEEPVVEETSEEVEAKSTPGITGEAIGVGSKVKSIFTSKITYSIIIGILVVFVGLFIIKKKIHSKSGGGNYADFKIKKEETDEDAEKKESDERKEAENAERRKMKEREKLEDAEKKLDEAKKELDYIKNKDVREEKLSEAKARFERDKAALEELEKE